MIYLACFFSDSDCFHVNFFYLKDLWFAFKCLSLGIDEYFFTMGEYCIAITTTCFSLSRERSSDSFSSVLYFKIKSKYSRYFFTFKEWKELILENTAVLPLSFDEWTEKNDTYPPGIEPMTDTGYPDQCSKYWRGNVFKWDITSIELFRNKNVRKNYRKSSIDYCKGATVSHLHIRELAYTCNRRKDCDRDFDWRLQ
jgi:hypothetical protein